MAMTMKFLTPVRRTLSTHVASMPYVPSGVIRALLDTARAGVTVRVWQGRCAAVRRDARTCHQHLVVDRHALQNRLQLRVP
jgi:hypothetical protein